MFSYMKVNRCFTLLHWKKYDPEHLESETLNECLKIPVPQSHPDPGLYWSCCLMKTLLKCVDANEYFLQMAVIPALKDNWMVAETSNTTVHIV